MNEKVGGAQSLRVIETGGVVERVVADEKVETLEKNMEILLDENVDTKDDVAGLGIQTGDIIAMDPRTTVTESGYIKSSYLEAKL